jgi:hypothetical protein
MTVRLGPRTGLHSFVNIWLMKVSTMTYNNTIYLTLINAMNGAEKSSSDEEEGEEVLKVMVDILGHPILPKTHIESLKLRQVVVREIFTKAYSKFNFSCISMIF